MRALKVLTEDELIAAIADTAGSPPRWLRMSIGDDAAVWKTQRSHYNLVTTDMLVDGVHFRLAETTPQALGHKALAVNLSDVAAMAAQPSVAVVALGITDVVDETWAREFYRGMATLAASHHCAIAGGDIARAPALTIAVTICGNARWSDLRFRSGARPGDAACVSGPLGLAAAWLDHMRSTGGVQDRLRSDARNASALPENDAALLRAAYETPAPRVAEGMFLGSSRAVHALMDISDGLSLDGARMARASGADLVLDRVAMQALIARTPLRSYGAAALEFVLHGGDDYELLAAVDGRAYRNLAKRFRARFGRELAIVGRFEQGSGKVWIEEKGERREHTPRGYDHFASTPA